MFKWEVIGQSDGLLAGSSSGFVTENFQLTLNTKIEKDLT
jgi:hypothetical protein